MSDKSEYQANYEDDFLKITDENSAFAYLLGLSSKPFKKYCSIFSTAKKNNKVIPEADRPFMSDYSDYLEKHFALGMPARDYVHLVYSSAKALQKWDGDFERYARALHDEGFIFQNKTYEALKAKSIRFEYSDTGWAVSFYKRWLREDLWTLEEAKCLFRGEDPKGGRNYYDLSQNRFSIAHEYIWDSYDSNFVELQDRMDRSIAAEALPAKKINNTWHFNPQRVVEWLLKHTDHIPPEPLLLVLRINESREDEEQMHAKKKYDFDTMKKADREAVILNYASDFWKENGHPRIRAVKAHVRKNPNFLIRNKSWETILTPITEKNLQETLLRKNT